MPPNVLRVMVPLEHIPMIFGEGLIKTVLKGVDFDYELEVKCGVL